MPRAYDIHPLADIFPPANVTDFDALAVSIRQIGLQNPIVLYEGKILDGRNRYVACLNTQVEPRFTQYEGNDPLAFVIAANLARRHLNESQRATVAAKIANMRRGDNQHTQICAPVSQDQAAEMLSVSSRSVQAARAVIDRGAPELVAMVEQGQLAVSAAAEVIQLPVARQREVARQGAQAVRAAARQQREARQHQPKRGPSPTLRKLISLWDRTTPAEKRAFRRHIDG